MKVFLDDERLAPDGWVRVRWPEEAIALLETGGVDELSLDHDLGNDEHGTGYDVLLWLEEAVATGHFVPPLVRVHSANVSARQKMDAAIAAIQRYAVGQPRPDRRARLPGSADDHARVADPGQLLPAKSRGSGSMTDNEMRIRLRLSAQEALLGQVPPTLRTVSVGVRDSVIYFRAVFDPAANEDDRELLSEVATMILADFPDAQMDEECLVIAPPTRPPHFKWLVFQRWEPQPEEGGS